MLLTLGNNLWLPNHPPATLAPEDLHNTWLIGQTGKSTLLENLAMQLAHTDIPFAFIDPLSRSIPDLLHSIPARHVQNVVYLDSGSEDIIGWNPLEDLNLQQEKVASQMVSLLETMLESGSFLYRSQDLLKMAVLALNGLPDATLLHIPRLLTDDEWRRLHIVPKLTGSVKAFWHHEYEAWIKDRERSMAISPLMNKMRLFSTNSKLRDILCAKERISPRQITQGKIFLTDLNGQELGPLETSVLASLLLARLSLAATQPYIVIIDNVEYVSSGILTAALANPNLRIIMAHMYGAQVDVDAVMSYVQNLLVFQVNKNDARQFEDLFPENVQVRHLVDQRPYTCYAKLGQQVFRLETLPLFDIAYAESRSHILEQNRRRYTRPRKAIHAYLRHQGV